MATSFENQAIKLGDLIQEALSKTGKDTSKCAEAIGVNTDTFTAYEKGAQAPSLPELEALAFYLDIPVEFFWGRASIPVSQEERTMVEQLDNLLPLRHRIIGVILRKARMDAGISFEELERYVEIDTERLKAFERGDTPVSLPELEVISVALNLSIREFQTQSGPVGKWAMQKKSIEGFLDLPPEMQQFVSKPVNMPYLELAQRLSEMSVDRLRSVAEGLLEITL
jgi:transcriptional regulator with XRE-family HTH domain